MTALQDPAISPEELTRRRELATRELGRDAAAWLAPRELEPGAAGDERSVCELPLSPEDWNALLQARLRRPDQAPLLERAAAFFHDLQEARAWMESPALSLGGRTPLSAWEENPGAEVWASLDRASWGVFS